LTRHLLKEIKVEVEKFPKLPTIIHENLRKWDIRFGMEFGEIEEVAQHKKFPVFNAAELVVVLLRLALVSIHVRK
jgi:aspartyl-tRNA synthetase